jgi:hypothetical protein
MWLLHGDDMLMCFACNSIKHGFTSKYAHLSMLQMENVLTETFFFHLSLMPLDIWWREPNACWLWDWSTFNVLFIRHSLCFVFICFNFWYHADLGQYVYTCPVTKLLTKWWKINFLKFSLNGWGSLRRDVLRQHLVKRHIFSLCGNVPRHVMAVAC